MTDRHTLEDIDARFLRLQHRLEAVEALLIRSNTRFEKELEEIWRLLNQLEKPKP